MPEAVEGSSFVCFIELRDEGRRLWTRFHATGFSRRIRDDFKLNRPDAGWYQVRRALKAHGDTELTDFKPFEAAYAALSAKVRPMVFELASCRARHSGPKVMDR